MSLVLGVGAVLALNLGAGGREGLSASCLEYPHQ